VPSKSSEAENNVIREQSEGTHIVDHTLMVSVRVCESGEKQNGDYYETLFANSADAEDVNSGGGVCWGRRERIWMICGWRLFHESEKRARP